MKKPIRFLLTILLFTPLLTRAQTPVDNPYRTRYSPVSHWTDSLRWNNITLASSISGLVLTGGDVDSTAMQNLMNQVSSSGGGVILFSGDTFKFSYDLIIPSGVILRGTTPVVPNAQDEFYRPLTIFAFPKYNPVFSGNGTPNSTAFKSIRGKENASNIALVNLDINRAHIGFHPENWTDAPGINTKWPVDINSNILIFGVRSNNVAIPDPGVPAAATGSQPAQEGWQRYVWRFTSNIGLYVSRNGVIANCRVNDRPTDSYNQPGYIIQNATNGNCFANGNSKLNPDGSDARFEYTDHIGIDLNRAKINKDRAGSGTGPNGKYGIYGFVSYANPINEPQLFAPGNEIRDCYVYKTRRVGIIAAGNGLVVDNNQIRDKTGKIAFIRANGQGCETNNSATHENRGMDVSGWNLQVTRNDIEVFRHTIGGPNGYGSVDGEGILVQECCGGTSVRDYNFKFNKLSQASSGYIGLWKMQTMYNVHLDSNDLGCKNIFLTANTNGASFGLYNSTINGNTNLNGIQSNADLGGSNLVIEGNAFCGTGTITAPGFATVSNNGNATFTPGPGSQVAVPTLTMVSPTQNELVEPGALVLLEAQATDADSIRFFTNATALTPYGPASSNSFSWTAPQIPGQYFLAAQAKNANGMVWSNTVSVTVRNPASPLSVSRNTESLNAWVLPNPSEGRFRVLTGDESGSVLYTVSDLSGKTLTSGNLLLSSPELDLSSLPSGTYLLRIAGKDRQKTMRIVRN